MNRQVSQIELAKALRITPRRVRQLIEDKILPEAEDDGTYDEELCSRWYYLYSRGTDLEWDHFMRRLDDDAHNVEELRNIALSPEATGGDLAAAANGVIDLYADVRFMTAARSKGSERELLLRLADFEERYFFAPIYQAAVAMVEKQVVTCEPG